MAAHPFGPIENQLIVGYYKRGFSPAKVRPFVQTTKVENLFDGTTDPSHYLLKPVFYGWSPANGNSSSHDFRVGWQFQVPRVGHELLSRGLGYRITFTMPEQEIRTEDPAALIRGDLEILDFTGIYVLGRLPLHMDYYDELDPDDGEEPPEWLAHIKKYKCVQYEWTHLGTKIVENGTDEYLFPVYSPPGSSIDERHLAAAERHSSVLGDRQPRDIRYLDPTLEWLAVEHYLVTKPQKIHMREHVLRSVTDVVKLYSFFAESKFANPDITKSVLPQQVHNLESDIRKWLDDEGPFPRYVLVDTMLESATRVLDKKKDFDWRKEQIFDALGSFDLRPLMNGLLDTLKLEVADGMRWFPLQMPLAEFRTKNFTVRTNRQNHWLYKTAEGADTVFKILDFDKKGNTPLKYLMSLRVARDSLLCVGTDSSGCYLYELSLDEVYSHHLDPNFKVEIKKIADSAFSSDCMTYCGTHGVLIVNQETPELINLRMFPIRFDDPSKTPGWLIDFRVRIEGMEATPKITHFASFLSKTHDVYLGSVHSKAQTSCRGVWLALFTNGRDSQKLQLKHQQFFEMVSGGFQHIQLKWLEPKSGHVFACAFTPDCRLWAFMYWRGRFVTAGHSSRNNMKPHSIPAQINGFCESVVFDHSAPRIGYSKISSTTAAKLVYQFTRIGLRF